VSQLVDAQVIKRLRDLDMPLRAVAEVVAARDPEVTRRVIADHEQVMRERLVDLTRIVDALQAALDEPATQTPAFIRTEGERHVLAVTELVKEAGHDSYVAFLDRAYGAIRAAITRLGVVPDGSPGALYPPKVEDRPELVTALMPVTHPVLLDDEAVAAGVTNQMLPADTCAVLTHSGSYRSMGETYRKLGAWVVTNAMPADRPVREWYVVSIDEATTRLVPDEELRTEIAWPIDLTTDP
jgi:effector-binding domain-containing protein